MALLEYYAFIAASSARVQAQRNYRLLARSSLREFIFRKVGFRPLDHWVCFHDRLLINSVPAGYFSVFRETADIMLSAIQHGLCIDSHTMPDISVGQNWSRYWKSNGLQRHHGSRMKFPHHFPDYFPQPGTVMAWVYPLSALGPFRLWLQQHYLPHRYPNYLRKKASQGAVPASHISPILEAVTSPILIPGQQQP